MTVEIDEVQPPEGELAEEEVEIEESGDGDPNGDSHQSTEDTAKRLKDTQAALTKANQKNAELEKSIAVLSGKVDAALAMGKREEKVEEVDPFAFLDDEEVVTTLLDDPKNIVDALKKVLAGVGGTLRKRDEAIFGEIQRRDPKVTTLREKIEELKNDPETKALGLSDEELIGVAKRELAKKPAKSNDEDGFRGSPGSGRRVAPKKDAEFERAVTEWDRRIGYDRLGK